MPATGLRDRGDAHVAVGQSGVWHSRVERAAGRRDPAGRGRPGQPPERVRGECCERRGGGWDPTAPPGGRGRHCAGERAGPVVSEFGGPV